MNNVPTNSFCKKSQLYTIKEILDYYNTNLILTPLDLTFMANGVGLEFPLSDAGPDQVLFYTFWANKDNATKLGNIIRYSSDTLISCEYSKGYNYLILHSLFCNNIPGTLIYPVIGTVNQPSSLQTSNVYFYFTKDGPLNGFGLQKCTSSKDADPGDSESLFYSFCQAVIPSDQEDQSLFISGNRDIYKWCGCYVNPSNFSSSKGPEDKYNCNPLCNFDDTIKRYSQTKDTGDAVVLEVCTETICAIDEVSIRLVDSNGNINFNQICPGCATGGNCTCIIDSSVQGILDKISTDGNGTQNQDSFKQVCPNANCYLSNPDGEYDKITCNKNNTSNTNKDPVLGYSGNGFLRNISEEEIFTTTNYNVFIFFFLIFILFIGISLSSLGEIDFFRYKNRNKIYNNDTDTPIRETVPPRGDIKHFSHVKDYGDPRAIPVHHNENIISNVHVPETEPYTLRPPPSYK